MNHPVASHGVSVVIPAKAGIQYQILLDPGSVSGMTRRRKRRGIRPLLRNKGKNHANDWDF
jgi:hypothetical protein